MERGAIRKLPVRATVDGYTRSSAPVGAAAPCGRSERALPMRLTTDDVCRLARYSRATLWRRIKAGQFPAPRDRGRQAIFDRDAVLQALKLGGATEESSPEHRCSGVREAIAEYRKRTLFAATIPPQKGKTT